MQELNKETEQILLGSVLGDACIRIGWTSKKSGKEMIYFDENHCIKQKDYLYWKADKLGLKVKKYSGKAGKIYSSKLPYLKEYYYLFHKDNKKKIITKEILNKLEPLSLAVWYCDDGCYNYKSSTCVISTETFDYNEHILMEDWFKERWNLDCGIHRKLKNYYIAFNVKSTPKFINLIKGYVPKCMEYKLGFDEEKKRFKRDNSSKQRRERWQRIKDVKNKERRENYIKDRENILQKNREWYNKNKEEYNRRRRMKTKCLKE